mmetsp:Transcript_96816/g.152563  ORF Transcript_96816/g.152563 Transcript_96816/m.152563 type:complete len:248 (-) Transcript_96816:46-789(-)
MTTQRRRRRKTIPPKTERTKTTRQRKRKTKMILRRPRKSAAEASQTAREKAKAKNVRTPVLLEKRKRVTGRRRVIPARSERTQASLQKRKKTKVILARIERMRTTEIKRMQRILKRTVRMRESLERCAKNPKILQSLARTTKIREMLEKRKIAKTLANLVRTRRNRRMQANPKASRNTKASPVPVTGIAVVPGAVAEMIRSPVTEENVTEVVPIEVGLTEAARREEEKVGAEVVIGIGARKRVRKIL